MRGGLVSVKSAMFLLERGEGVRKRRGEGRRAPRRLDEW